GFDRARRQEADAAHAGAWNLLEAREISVFTVSVMSAQGWGTTILNHDCGGGITSGGTHSKSSVS
ncbi:MAG TPA: hypothetical protein VK764_11040, partial [Terracidiphilus sp.]|nr:hypothetical protein [Terracidiphilus sp.]